MNVNPVTEKSINNSQNSSGCDNVITSGYLLFYMGLIKQGAAE